MPLRCCLRTAVVAWGIFFGAGSLCVLNFFQANGLAPSGGHILSSPAKKEYGKKDAAQGGGFPALRTHPLGWVSVVRVVMFRLPGRLVTASVPCWPVCRPLAASLLLTDCTSDLKALFRGCTLFRLNGTDFRDAGLQTSTLRRKRKRSGKRFAHQVGQRMQSQACLVPRTVCGCSPDAVCRGRIPKVGGMPPAFGGVFLPQFFLRY